MSLAVSGTAITFPDATTQTTSPFPGGFAFRNRIINGAMMIDQRNAGASVTPTSGQYLVDRFEYAATQASKMSAVQTSTGLAGFPQCLKLTSSSSYAVLATDYFVIRQKIEGNNIADLNWGTSSAQTVTLSFWVYSSLTGTFGGTLLNSAADRSYAFTYTVTSANTWEQKTVTVAGDTSGTWLTTNGIGINLQFGLGVGSTYSKSAGSWGSGVYYSATGATSVVGTSGATFYITGVQLEKNTVATPFDYRPYGTELALCQRYCYVVTQYCLGVNSGGYYPASTLQPKVSFRATPTLSNASFPVGGGSCGLNANTSAECVMFVNNSGNWGSLSSTFVNVSCTLSAEL